VTTPPVFLPLGGPRVHDHSGEYPPRLGSRRPSRR
jgi:hypothetical protein